MAKKKTEEEVASMKTATLKKKAAAKKKAAIKKEAVAKKEALKKKEVPYEKPTVYAGKFKKEDLPVIDGIKVVDIVGVSANEQAYHCLMENGSTQYVPKELFE